MGCEGGEQSGRVHRCDPQSWEGKVQMLTTAAWPTQYPNSILSELLNGGEWQQSYDACAPVETATAFGILVVRCTSWDLLSRHERLVTSLRCWEYRCSSSLDRFQ